MARRRPGGEACDAACVVRDRLQGLPRLQACGGHEGMHNRGGAGASFASTHPPPRHPATRVGDVMSEMLVLVGCCVDVEMSREKTRGGIVCDFFKCVPTLHMISGILCDYAVYICCMRRICLRRGGGGPRGLGQ